VAAALLAGRPLEEAVRLGTRMGARNVSHRGATGLREHLLGRLATV
jgi:sugar/nucleoside kinase (ribokinase family)